MNLPPELLDVFPPSADLLFDWARRRSDDVILREFANADYGHGADELLPVLRHIRADGVIPDSLEWRLHEVLALTRWCDPERPERPPFAPGLTGRPGHLKRIFACAILLLAEARSTGEFDDVGEATLAQCLTSAHQLGNEVSRALGCFLTWRFSQEQVLLDRTLYAIGLLIIALRLHETKISDQTLEKSANWILEEEAIECRELPFDPTDPPPLALGIREGFWRPLAIELRCESAVVADQDVREKLELIALHLEPNWPA